jgi:hypothetical protein
MIFTIKRAGDSINSCARWEKPCNNSEAIPVLSQLHIYHADGISGSEKWTICPQPLLMHIISLDSLDDLVSLIEEVGSIIVEDSPYEATPGDRGDNAPWKEPARDLNGNPIPILDGAHSIIIYDDYME